MIVKVLVHTDPTGGFWAEVPAMPGCLTQAETRADLDANLREAIEGWLMAENSPDTSASEDEVEILELAI